MNFLVYLVALAVSAATLAVSVELITRPDQKPVQQVVASTAPVRQIPIDKTAEAAKTAEADRADANTALSPVYSAAPRKDLMPPAVAATNKPAQNANTPPIAPLNTVATAPAATTSMISPINTMNIKPEETTRSASSRVATATPVAIAVPVTAAAPVAQKQNAAPQRRVKSRAEELDEVARVVRRLPPPSQASAFYDRDDDGRIVVMQRRPTYGYGRPTLIYEDD